MRFAQQGRVDPKPRRDVVWPVALAGMIAAVFGIFVFLPGGPTVQLVASGGVTLLALTLAWKATPRSPRELAPRTIAADERGLFVDGALLVPRRAIRAAAPNADGMVRIELGRGRSQLVAFDDLETAHAFVRALGLHEEASVARYRALPPWSKHLGWLAVLLTTSPWILLNLLRFLSPAALVVVLLLYAVLALPMVLPQNVEIGHDGVLFSWLEKRRFVPYRRMREVRVTPHGVALELDDMRVVEIRLTQKPDADLARSAEVARRVRAAMERHAQHARAEEESFLARGSRSLDDWLRDMRALGTGEAGAYRTISIPRERLWAILENPSADPSAREGAALALHAALDDDERARLAAIGVRSAAPRLRVALETLAETQDEKRVRVAVEQAEEVDDAAPLSTRAKERS